MEQKKENKISNEKKMVVFTFGKIGAGKNWVAEQIEHMFREAKEGPRFVFCDGDSYLSWFNRRVGFLSEGGVKSYIEKNLVPGIDKLLEKHDYVVSSYAFYIEAHRQLVHDYYAKKNVTVKFIFVDTPKEQQNSQLKSRASGCGWNVFAQIHDGFFQPPTNQKTYVVHTFINSNNDNDLKAELQKCYLFVNPPK